MFSPPQTIIQQSQPFLFIVMWFYPLLLNVIIIQQGKLFAVYCIVFTLFVLLCTISFAAANLFKK